MLLKSKDLILVGVNIEVCVDQLMSTEVVMSCDPLQFIC